MNAPIMRRVAFGYDPLTTAPANVPAFANESPNVTSVTLTHPSNDRHHPSVVAAVRRYEAKGWTVIHREFTA